MRRTAVRDSDRTTTGGFVIAVTSTIFDEGKRVAVDGDAATCGNCEGALKIFGSARRMSCHGRNVVLNGDPVLCPCGQNRVIAAGNSKIFYEEGDNARGVTKVETQSCVPPIQSAVAPQYDEKVRCTAHTSTLTGYSHHIVARNSGAYSRRVNSSGALPRVDTEKTADDYVIYWGDDAISKQYEV
ncbi:MULTISPECIES: PAAR domain-containing protein [Burkholderia]|uniref:PAAR domain-containing protein n=1 Tax=Burkholderia TaxID=32008 RepID=UPI001583BDC9|nr:MULTISPECIES: PAAR domain-containing protein [Burkholderia]